MNPGLLIPIVAIAAPFTMIIFLRYYKNVERMAMIERGLAPDSAKDVDALKEMLQSAKAPSNPFSILKWALLLVGAGTGLVIGNLIGAFLPESVDGDVAVGITFGLVSVLSGAALFVAYVMESSHKKREGERKHGSDVV